MTALASAFAHRSVVEEGDTKAKEDQSGALDETCVANFFVDTSVPSRIEKGVNVFKEGTLRCTVDLAGCFVDRPGGVHDLCQNRSEVQEGHLK